MRKALIACIGGLALLVISGAANAAVTAEIGDAGDLPATAQSVGTNTDQITGLAGGFPGDIDMFGFSWSGGALTIDTAGSSFDTMLWLFDSSGIGILGNDDTLPGFQAQLALGALPTGDYFVAISTCCTNQPQSAGGAIFPDLFGGGQFGPTGPGGGQPISAWPSSGPPGIATYVINFSAEVNSPTGVPEPSTLGLIGLGLLGLGAIKRRRRKLGR